MTVDGAAGPAAGRVRCPVLVGRDEELALLLALIDGAAQGRGGAVFLRGEGGIGKSRLVDELLRVAADHGATTLRGRCVPQGQTPLRPFAEALLSTARVGGLPEAVELRPFRHSLGRLVPQWHDEEQGSDSPLLTAEGLLRLARLLAGTTATVLVVEDLHWADVETATALEYLVDHCADHPVLVLGTLRGGVSRETDQVVSDLQQRGSARVVRLGPLSPSQVSTMILSCAHEASPETVATVVERSDGVPLLVEELLSVPVTGVGHAVPATYAEAIGRRLATLGDESTLAARSAALLGRTFDWRLLCEVTGLPADAVHRALGECLEAHLLETDAAGRFSFRHALARDAVLSSTLAPQRVVLARRAARVVEDSLPAAPDEAAAVLAADLWSAAEDPERAAAVLLDAGRAASRRGGLATAEDLLRRARELDVADPSLHADAAEALTHVLALAAKLEEALRASAEAFAHLEGLPGTGARRAGLHLTLARAAVAATRWSVAREQLRGARPLVDADPHLQAGLMALEAQVAIGEQDLDLAERLASRAVTLAGEASNPEAECEALEVLGRRERLRDLPRAEALFQAAHDLATARGLAWWRLRSLQELGTIDMLERSLPTRLERASDLAYRTGAISVAATVDLQLAGLHAFLWELDRAEAAARRAVDVAGTLGLGQVHATALVQLAFVHALSGRRDDMERVVDDAVARADRAPETMALLWGHVRATCSLLEEDRSRALEELRRARSWSAQAPGTTGAFAVLEELLHAVAPSSVAAAPLADRARTEPIPMNAALLEMACAVTDGRAGRGRTAEERVAHASERLRALRMDGWLHLSRRLVAEAAVADGWGTPGPWLTEAWVFFSRSGNSAVADACRDLLRRAGLPAPGRCCSDVPTSLVAVGVTPREAEVLRLLGDRLTNKEIAARLYLSPRTVEKHVERLCTKTGRPDRVALGRLAREVLVPEVT